MGTVRGVLLDLEGVLYQDGAPIFGAIETVARLHAAQLSLRFLTNTTTQPRRHIVERMCQMGFDVDIDHFFSPALAAGKLLKDTNITRLFLAAPVGLKEDFLDFELVEHDAGAVVLGDLYLGFDWSKLNQAFEMLQSGAQLLALHKNRYCRRGDHIALDLGPFVAALEYAAGVEAQVAGKPSPAFFTAALASMGLECHETIMVGDDIEADIGGAQRIGIRGIQVRTGKYNPNQIGSIEPDAIIDSVAELPQCIAALSRDMTDPGKSKYPG